MITIYTRLVVLVFLMSSIACAYEVNMVDQSKLIGESFREAVERNKIIFSDDFVIEEPVGIARGAWGTTSNNDTVYFYIPRNSVKKRNSKWVLDDFYNQKVVGIAVRHDSQWKTFGQVLPYYHVNHP